MSSVHLSELIVVQYDGRLGTDNSLVACDGGEAVFVDDTIAADDGVATGRNGNLLSLLRSIQDNDDVTPVVAPCIVFQSEGNGTFRCIQEL